MLIFFSFYVFKAPVTRLNLFGYAFCCSGVAVYNYQKLQVGRGQLCYATAVLHTAASNAGSGAHAGGARDFCHGCFACNLHNLRWFAASMCLHAPPASCQPVQLLKKKALQKQKEVDISGKADMESARPLLANGGTNGKTEGSRD